MKILLINDYNKIIGGAEQYIYEVKSELIERGHTVHLLSSDSNKLSKPTVGKLISLIFNIKYFLEFKKEISKFKPDIVHIHGIFNELSPSVLLSVPKNTPIIMTIHNNQLISPVSRQSERNGKSCKKELCEGCTNCVGLKGLIYETLKGIVHKLILRKVNLFITPSKFMKKLVIKSKYFPVTHLMNGFKLFQFTKIKNYNRLIYVGRLTEDKGVQLLINAMDSVLKTSPEMKLSIVGDGKDRAIFKKLVKKLSLNKSVKFIGEVNKRKLRGLYKESTCVIVPSIYGDNLPTVCIEAMSSGRPVIGSKIGGIPELIDNNRTGLLFEPLRKDQLEKAIHNILSNKKTLLKMSELAFKKSAEFSIQKHVSRLEILYAKV